MDSAIRSFTIRVPDAVLAALKVRLKNPRYPEALQGDGWTYGTDIAYLKQLVAYWRDRFDWRAQERALNRFEQFTTDITGSRSISFTGARGSRTRFRCSSRTVGRGRSSSSRKSSVR